MHQIEDNLIIFQSYINIFELKPAENGRKSVWNGQVSNFEILIRVNRKRCLCLHLNVRPSKKWVLRSTLHSYQWRSCRSLLLSQPCYSINNPHMFTQMTCAVQNCWLQFCAKPSIYRIKQSTRTHKRKPIIRHPAMLHPSI